MPFGGEARYRAIFDQALDAMVVTDAAGSIRVANGAAERMFGYGRGEIVHAGIAMLIPEPGGGESLAAIAGTRREILGRRADATMFPLEISVALWESAGETFFTGVMRDISLRKEAEAVLARRETHLASLYAQSGAGLAETDSDGRFVAVNDRYCEIVGRTRDALMKLRLYDITHPDDLQRDLPLLERLVIKGGPFSVEERYVRGDGSVVWVTKTASPLSVEGGPAVALVVAIDVTERRLAETELQESEERLRLLQNEFAHLARVNDLGEMAAAIAHEINQPLTAIANFLSAGAMSVAAESTAASLAAAREAMKLAAEQGLRAGCIIRGLREFATKGDGSRQVERADTLVDTAMALALVDIRGTGIRLEHRRAGIDAMVEVDPVQIQQVLVNLLRNAVDALVTNPPGAERRLTVSTRDLPMENMVEFCVADTGPGIPPDICDRLFEPFVTSKAKGMGMGLSVCRRIVEAHGGTIEAECGDGQGAVLTVRMIRN